MIYDYPEYYEAAFSFRDLARETAFLKTCMDRYSGVPVQRVLEIACGHAPHAEELAALGYGYVGLDKNPNMLTYASERLQGLQPRPEFLKADMANFHCPLEVQFAYVMLGSLYLNTPEEMNGHFDSLARCLQPGGLYFLDWCVQFVDPLKICNANEVAVERNGIRTWSRFDIRLIDPESHLYEEVWTMKVEDHGVEKEFRITEFNRAILPEDFRRFVSERDDFEIVGWWCDWDLDRPIRENSQIDRPLVLLRRI